MKISRLLKLTLIFIIVLLIKVQAVPIYYIDNQEIIGYNIITELKIEIEEEKISQISRSKEIETEVLEISIEEEYSEHEKNLLIQLVHAEAGSSWLEDEHQQLVAAVVLNRVKNNYYPNSIEEVIYQKGQYSCINGPQWSVEPEERTVENVLKVLNKEVSFPDYIIYQSEFKQGNHIYKTFYSSFSKTTTYFCYE